MSIDLVKEAECLNIPSKTPNPRLCVIENTVVIENEISKVLARRLEINIRTSKVFGNSIKALSFNTKVEILKDLNFIEKETKAKFELLMFIRNQFAHNTNADKYLNLWSINKSETRKLIRFYSIEDSFESLKDNQKEKEVKGCIYILISELLTWLKEIDFSITVTRMTDEYFAKSGKFPALEQLLYELRDLPGGEDLINRVFYQEE